MYTELPESLKKLKLLWFCYSRILESGETFGSERIERVRHLAEEGHEETLVAAYFNKEDFAALNYPNMHLVSIPMKYKPVISTMLYGLFLFLFGPIYLAKYRPDFIISDHTTAPFLIWHPMLSRFLRFKTILDVRSTPVSSGTRAHIQFRLSVWIAKSIFNGITVVTPMMRDEICRSFKINPEWTAILSNGISDEVFSPEKEKNTRKALRAQLGFSGKFVIIYHGSLRETGGLVESIKAVALLKEEYPDVILFLLGQSTKEVEDLLKKTMKENNVEKNVVLHGAVKFDEVPHFIAMSDLGLVPLPNIQFWRYQQPIKLLEYMAMNKTFIVSESPAHRVIISNSKNAIYISHVTPPEIAKAVEYAYHNRDKLDAWGQTGRSIVMKKYVWKKLNEELMIYLRNVQLGKTRYATRKC
jgi:glycosyltransferase involved in cell wall biosynthesis